MNVPYKQQVKDSRGFTIIEVVLVLAIAGLIFLMVFIALPALQKGQRDAQRKEDVSRVATQLQNSSSALRGKIPTTQSELNAFTKGYLVASGTTNTAGCADTQYSDPSGSFAGGGALAACTGSDDGYRISQNISITGVPATGEIWYSNGFKCSTTVAGDVQTGSTRNYTLRVKLENQSAAYCFDGQ